VTYYPFSQDVLLIYGVPRMCQLKIPPEIIYYSFSNLPLFGCELACTVMFNLCPSVHSSLRSL